MEPFALLQLLQTLLPKAPATGENGESSAAARTDGTTASNSQQSGVLSNTAPPQGVGTVQSGNPPQGTGAPVFTQTNACAYFFEQHDRRAKERNPKRQ